MEALTKKKTHLAGWINFCAPARWRSGLLSDSLLQRLTAIEPRGGKKPRKYWPAVCILPSSTPSNTRQQEKTRNTIFSGFYANMTFSPCRLRGARFSVDHRYLPALLLRQQRRQQRRQQQQPQPLLHRLFLICYQQASESKSWAAPVPNLAQPCQMSKPSACRPIYRLHLRDWIVAHSWHLFFIITACYWRERLRTRYNNSSIWKRTFLCFSPPLQVFTLYAKNVQNFSAAALLMPTNQFNPPPHPPKKAADLIPSWFKFRAEAQIIDAASYVF